jgi:hypothetical protein
MIPPAARPLHSIGSMSNKRTSVLVLWIGCQPTGLSSGVERIFKTLLYFLRGRCKDQKLQENSHMDMGAASNKAKSTTSGEQ